MWRGTFLGDGDDERKRRGALQKPGSHALKFMPPPVANNFLGAMGRETMLLVNDSGFSNTLFISPPARFGCSFPHVISAFPPHLYPPPLKLLWNP